MDSEMFAIIADAQNEAMRRGVLNMWTVYDHPADFPHNFVARRFEVNGDGPKWTKDLVRGDLHMIREHFQRCGLSCLPRSENDDPQIVECWL